MSSLLLSWRNLAVLFCILNGFISLGQKQDRSGGLTANLNPTLSGDEKDNSTSEWREKLEERTVFSRSYVADDGTYKSIFSKIAINYFNEQGELVPINPNLSRSGNYWTAQQQQFPTFLFSDGSFGLSSAQKEIIKIGEQVFIEEKEGRGIIEFKDNYGFINNFIEGIDKELFFRENAVKYNYIISKRIDFGTDGLNILESIEIPKNSEVRFINGTAEIVDSKGVVVSTFQAPLCYDASNSYVLGKYSLKESRGKKYLCLHVPSEWINSNERNYPIVIDPVVSGPTSTWIGGTMDSCILPTYNRDSIQVTIPGGVTVTGLFVTASFYADPWTAATMGQGEMKFSTSCATSQAFTITGATANTAGTAYLDSFNLYNPLTCCFPESCTPQSFYLTMLLGRTGPGAGCNTTYIRYDPFTTQWPFSAVVVGKTVETYGNKWVVPISSMCSNECTIVGTAYVNMGVAPYTFTHPWSTQVVTQGQNTGCGTGSTNFQFTMTIPNCPVYCDTINTTLTVPPPVITDACGNVVSAIPAETVTIKPTPQLTVNADTLICSGTPFTIGLQTCISTAAINWAGNNEQGTGSISNTFTNTSAQVNVTNYIASTSLNGCSSDTASIDLYVEPNPVAAFSNSPDPAIVSIPITFNDGTINYSGASMTYNWDLGDQTTSTDQNPVNTYFSPGTYTVCMAVETPTGCTDTLCKLITVAPATVVPPNVITANKDGVNDLLAFKYLEFYPNNNLVILNRWGNVILEKSGYANDWNGDDLSAGTYFYKLIVNDGEQEYQGFFQIVR